MHLSAIDKFFKPSPKNSTNFPTTFLFLNKVTFLTSRKDLLTSRKDIDVIVELIGGSDGIAKKIVLICNYLNIEKDFNSFIDWIIELRKDLNISFLFINVFYNRN